MKLSNIKGLLFLLLIFSFIGCTTTESHRSLTVEQTQAGRIPYNGPRLPIAVGKIENHSSYMRGLFTSGDQLGDQAKIILMTHLQQTNRFTVLDRDNLEQARQEAEIRNENQELKGASYIISGGVSEFGRRETSDHQLFGILGRGKKQIAYAKVSFSVLNILTTELACSVQGAGEYELPDREVVGFGSASGYDSTLNGKVLDLAIREAVDRLTEAFDRGAWTP
jgi:curli biogenesis system outer membrane secretion channel CsgG